MRFPQAGPAARPPARRAWYLPGGGRPHVIITAAVAVILATVPATAHVPERCASHGESFEAAWTETLAAIRETFLLALELSPDQPADPRPRLLELVDEIEAARDAELGTLSAWFECVDGDE